MSVKIVSDSKNNVAIVDIGSNGIRFSISSIAPHHARIFPCLFRDRAAISMYDAQHTKDTACASTTSSKTKDDDTIGSEASTPHALTEAEAIAQAEAAAGEKNDISQSVIKDVCKTLVRFKGICADFGVTDDNVKIVATEATREAPNSQDFRKSILDATGWEVSLLSKAEEARSGAYGVASSFFEISGLFMDLGGGSTQLSWITCKDGEFKMSDTPVSLPYGAAALTRRLQKTPKDELYEEIKARLAASIEAINIPKELKRDAEKTGGFKLYVSGGGFRGLGHLLLARSVGNIPYPIQIINGFSCNSSDIEKLVKDQEKGTIFSDEHGKHKIFRVSDRRANQLPAVTLLVSVALEVFPQIRKVLFSQGGVREGVLFHHLPKEIRVQDPLYIASKPYAVGDVESYVDMLRKAVPEELAPTVIYRRLIPCLVNVAFVHSSFPRELQASAALEIAITGVVSGADGLSHEVRALIGLALCQRWGGELPNGGLARETLISAVSPKKLAWWAHYVGHLMHILGGVYPGGFVKNQDNLKLGIVKIGKSKESFRVGIKASDTNPKTSAPMVKTRIGGLEKKLKKLTKEFGPNDSYKVHVDVDWVV